ncbi:hypothetical protein D1J63_20735 [Streptomyces sp. KPB2]|nr:hypothetical protein D1J63_20735 [Streptomyces sp. KPB2]
MARWRPWLEGRAKGQSEGKAERRAEGKAESALRILEVWGIEIPDSVRARVASCTDIDALGTWLDRSLRVMCAEELLVDE